MMLNNYCPKRKFKKFGVCIAPRKFVAASPKREFKLSLTHVLSPLGLVVMFSLLGLVLLTGQLLIANKLATDGETLNNLERETFQINEENVLLQNQLVALGSLQRINEKAQSLGLVKVSKVEVITPIPYAYAP